MSDDLTARIDAALGGATTGPWHVGVERDRLLPVVNQCGYSVALVTFAHAGDAALIAAAPSLLAEARDEITRLREGIAAHRTWLIDDQGAEPHDGEWDLWALLDTPDAGEDET